jgi:hypothetical protein
MNAPTLKELIEKYRLALQTNEPGHLWYKLSFEIYVKTPEEGFEVLNALRKKVRLPPLEVPRTEGLVRSFMVDRWKFGPSRVFHKPLIFLGSEMIHEHLKFQGLKRHARRRSPKSR